MRSLQAYVLSGITSLMCLHATADTQLNYQWESHAKMHTTMVVNELGKLDAFERKDLGKVIIDAVTVGNVPTVGRKTRSQCKVPSALVEQLGLTADSLKGKILDGTITLVDCSGPGSDSYLIYEDMGLIVISATKVKFK